MTDRTSKFTAHEPMYAGLQKGIPFYERPTCSIAEACSAVGFGRTKLYELIDEGRVDTIHIGRRRLVKVPSLLRLLAPNTNSSD